MVLYAGTADDLVSVSLNSSEFDALREALAAMRLLLAAAAALLDLRGARARRGAAADALLAADRLRALRPPVHDGGLQGRRRPGAEGAGLRARLPGAGAGGQQGPGRQAAAGDKMMVHHLLYYTRGRVDTGPGGCLGGEFLGGRGEEHPNGRFDALWPPEQRAHYGVHNATAGGAAPEWTLTAMVMNHYQRAEALLRAHAHLVHDRAAHARSIRSRSATAATSATAWPTTCPAAASRARSSWTARPGPRRSARASSAAARITTAARRTRRWRRKTCSRTLLDARAYYGAPTTRTTRSARSCTSPARSPTARSTRTQGIPIAAGEVLERAAYHDNRELHVAAMGFWVLSSCATTA